MRPPAAPAACAAPGCRRSAARTPRRWAAPARRPPQAGARHTRHRRPSSSPRDRYVQGAADPERLAPCPLRRHSDNAPSRAAATASASQLRGSSKRTSGPRDRKRRTLRCHPLDSSASVPPLTATPRASAANTSASSSPGRAIAGSHPWAADPLRYPRFPRVARVRRTRTRRQAPSPLRRSAHGHGRGTTPTTMPARHPRRLHVRRASRASRGGRSGTGRPRRRHAARTARTLLARYDVARGKTQWRCERVVHGSIDEAQHTRGGEGDCRGEPFVRRQVLPAYLEAQRPRPHEEAGTARKVEHQHHRRRDGSRVLGREPGKSANGHAILTCVE